MVKGFTIKTDIYVMIDMAKWKKLSHTIYQCKYHIVWCPKYRYRILKGAVAEFVEQTLRMLCEWRSIEILEMNVKEDHIQRKPYWGNHFWIRGYCVSSISLDENKIRKYVKYQEEKEKREESDQQEFGLF